MINPTNLYTIGEISKLCNIPIKTLRYYDNEGLLRPEKRDNDNNYRYYSEKQLLQVLIIKELKYMGFSLESIRDFLKHQDLNLLQKKIEEKLNEIDANIQNLKMQLQIALDSYNRIKNGLNVLDNYRSVQINKNKQKIYDIELTEIPECNVVYSRYYSPINASELFLKRHAEIQKIADQNCLYICGPLIAIFHDHYSYQFFEQKCDIDLEVCFPIINGKIDNPFVKKFGGFLAAATIYVGGYAEMLSAYFALVEWIDHNGYEITGPGMEQYLIGPTRTDNEMNYVTRVFFPVTRKI